MRYSSPARYYSFLQEQVNTRSTGLTLYDKVNVKSDMKHYSDVLSPRMIRMDGTRFEYAVHETFQNFQAPTKILDDIADHFGYINDGDLQKRKSERNTKLLEERLKSEPNPSCAPLSPTLSEL